MQHQRPAGGAAAVVEPGDAGWDQARAAWNLTVDQRPAAVARPVDADGLLAALSHARVRELRVAAQGTGHGAAPLGPLGGTLLVSTGLLRDIAIDPAARRARVGAGVTWAEVASAAAAHGLAGLAGSSPDVGVVGYTLGGGLGWLARKHGLACNRVLAVEIATAEQGLLRCDRESHGDLFWAVRGGGGSFGVVTALEFELLPIATVQAGVLLWPMERAAEVLAAWSEWTREAPDEVTSVGRLLRLPPLPEVPEPLRGGRFAAVEIAHLGEPGAGDALLRPLRALAPAIDTVSVIPASQLGRLHMDPDHPVPVVADGMLLDGFGRDAARSLVDAAGAASGSGLLTVEVRHLGGAVASAAHGHGATARIRAPFAEFAAGIAPAADAAAAAESDLDAVRDALACHLHADAYLNFCERPVSPGRLFEPEVLRRLGSVKAAYDPADVFRSNHPIPPLADAPAD